MDHGTNAGVFRYLRQGKDSWEGEPVQAPVTPNPRHYWNAGSHPDVVERLWDQIGRALPRECKATVFGTPALIHPQSGLVLAFAMGTEYAVRLPREILETRRPADLRTVAKWTGGGSTDIVEECGPDWALGAFADAEVAWCQQLFREQGGLT
jgi:hypothetical protein